MGVAEIRGYLDWRYKPGQFRLRGQVQTWRHHSFRAVEFKYRQGDFNLHSEGMEWLVVVNSNWARFQGAATIKGVDGLFPFRVHARDGDPDRLVTKIWAPGANPDEPI